MIVLRAGLVLAALMWVVVLAAVVRDGGGAQPHHWQWPLFALIFYGLYWCVAVWKGVTVWKETWVLGIALLPWGLVLTLGASLWGAGRWLRGRG